MLQKIYSRVDHRSIVTALGSWARTGTTSDATNLLKFSETNLSQSAWFGSSRQVKAAEGGGGRVVGLNIYKNGQDPEEMKEVPEWLALLAEEGNGKSLVEMERLVADMEQVDLANAKYLKKLQNRSKIKQNNTLKAK